MISRRRVIASGAWLAGGLSLTSLGSEGPSMNPGTRAELETSELIYLTPLKRDGSESRCHGEVWFQYDGADIWVVTAHDAWRAEAVRQGLTRARAWVGEFGVWTGAGNRFRSAPMLETEASLETDPKEHERVLDLMGGKYTLEWIVWGRRFRNGLADGSRVMLRYRPVA